jgi:hypothetical protein
MSINNLSIFNTSYCEATWAAIGVAKVKNVGHRFDATCSTN